MIYSGMVRHRHETTVVTEEVSAHSSLEARGRADHAEPTVQSLTGKPQGLLGTWRRREESLHCGFLRKEQVRWGRQV